MLLHKFTFIALFIYLASLAATQTVYGAGLEAVRWISLLVFVVFGGLSYFTDDTRFTLQHVNTSLGIYLLLWTSTVIFGQFPLFSAFRLTAHAAVLVGSLLFLPQLVTFSNAPRILTALKMLVATTLLISYIQPARRTVFDTASAFRGIFGNANSFGHICAIGSLLFLHGFITNRRTRWGYVQAALTILSTSLLIRSGARSSAVALIVGILTLSLLYRKLFSRNLLIVWCVGSLILLAALKEQTQINAFLNKHSEFDQLEQPMDRIGASRIPLWAASWEAFTERPIFGWGFGVDKDADMAKWNGQFTSLGFTKRDPVNDFTYTLETGGVIGFFAYFYLLTLLPKMWTTRQRILPLLFHLPPTEQMRVLSALESQQLFMSLALALAAMFELDGTALSAGSFFAVLLWVSLGFCVALRSLLLVDLPRRLTIAHQLYGRAEYLDPYPVFVSES